MPNIELHGYPVPEVPEVMHTADKLRKHLKHTTFGNDCAVTVVDDRCKGVIHPCSAPFIRIFVDRTDDIDAIIGALDDCPHLNIAGTYDIEVIRLERYRPRRR